MFVPPDVPTVAVTGRSVLALIASATWVAMSSGSIRR